jgi:hypothetical protein
MAEGLFVRMSCVHMGLCDTSNVKDKVLTPFGYLSVTGILKGLGLNFLNWAMKED